MNNEDSSMAANAIANSAQRCYGEIVDFSTFPHVLMRPRIYPDGNQWCALYGENILNGVVGFGSSPHKAVEDFNRNWFKDLDS